MLTQRHQVEPSTNAPGTQCPAVLEDDRSSSLGYQPSNMYDRSNLTKRQLFIWTGQKVNPGVPLYNMIRIFTITGEVSPDHFRKAFQEIITRNDAFRMIITELEGMPQLEFLKDVFFEPEYLDFSATSDARVTFERWLRQRSGVPLNLSERLFDSALIKMEADRYIWYLCQHHIMTDAWSTLLVYRRMAEYYELSRQGRLGEDTSSPRFADFVDYERSYRHSSRYQKDEAYWNRKLADPVESVSFYGTTLSDKATRKHRVTYDLGYERSRKLKSMAVEEGRASITTHLSVFNVFAALLLTYICRVSGNRRPAIGTPFHNRSSASFKETVGLLTEVCPLRIEIAEDDNFTSIIAKISREVRESLSHYMYSVGNPIRNRTYEVLLNYHKISYPTYDALPMRAEWLHSGHGDGNESLALQVHDFDGHGSFVLYFDFNTDVFDEEQRIRAVQHFVNIVDAILADMTKPIGSIDLLSEEERRCVVSKFNKTGSPVPNMTIAQLFEAQVERTPDKTAVVMGHEQISYRDLNARANCLAHYLRTCGVTAETLVGIYMDRSIEMVFGLLGVLKAGGAYVPLDPGFPKERLEHMLHDSGAQVVLTQCQFAEEIPNSNADRLVIFLDSDWPLISLNDSGKVSGISRPSNLAYVIYTSGSTGKPKGVQIENGAVVNFLTSMRRRPGLVQNDVLLSVTTLSFDIAALEIFLPLTTGAQVVLVNRETSLDAHRLTTVMNESGTTVMQATPSTWRMLIDGGWKGEARLKVLCGGEALPRLLADQLLGRCGELWNMYGPTETTIWSAVYHVRPGVGSVPIGEPIANTRLLILDEKKKPVPFGVSGELYIGGAGLARGYLNRPDLTAEKFVPDTVSGECGARLYRTGDFVRRLSDGNVEFLRRVDNQIKLRGFRVELGEIESVLAEHPALREVAVVIREDSPGDRRLVAYAVPEREREPMDSELRNLARTKVPDYMVPSHFILMAALPRTPNGKLDPRALPAPNDDNRSLEIAHVPPQNDVEEKIATVWREVLQLKKIGVEDNFFDVGGHSILLVQVHAKLQNIFAKNLSVIELFQYPTIRLLAEHLGCARNDSNVFNKIHQRAKRQKNAFAGHRTID